MTNDEFVRLMKEHLVSVEWMHAELWEARIIQDTGNAQYRYQFVREKAGDPVEAMERLAKRLGWIGGGEE